MTGARPCAGRPLRRGLARLATALALALGGLAAAARGAGAQELNCDPGDLEVRRLRFSGNRRFGDLELANAIVTTPSDLLRRVVGALGERRCIEPGEVERDRYRMVIFYRNRGFHEATVDTVVRHPRPGRVNVEFRISEGPPVAIDTFVVAGLDSIPGAAALTRNLPLELGDPLDRYRRELTRDTLVRRLRDRGYPYARVLANYAADLERRRATVEYTVVPGRRARIDSVDIEVTPRPGAPQSVPDRTVRGLLDVRPADLYRERDLVRAQRTLYGTEAYDRVSIAIDSARSPDDSLVTVRVRLAESFTHAAATSVGYGTLDCLRAQGEYTDRNFLRRAGRLDLTGRLSKVGIGEPLDWAPALCGSRLQDDRYSQKLNYYAGATLRQPVLLGLRSVPALTVFSERRSEYGAYLRTTNIGAIASITSERRPRTPAVLGYQLELGRTEAEPALFCAVFNLCEVEARQQVERTKPLAVASFALTRNRANDPVAPSRGSLARLELRHASRLIGSDPDLQFNKLQGDASWYRGVAGRTVLAFRLRAGAVVGTRLNDSTRRFIPPQERLYAGGPSSVRGYRQNELGPIVYTISAAPAAFDTTFVRNGVTVTETYLRAESESRVDRVVPTGGNAVAVANVELRFRSPILSDLIQLNTFVDVGQVWNPGVRNLNLDVHNFRWTPGVGARVTTPIGAIGLDVGYKYDKYRRQPGAAYYATPVSEEGASDLPVFCVSPGNTVPTEVDAVGRRVQVGGGSCPATFRPAEASSFLRGLNLNFSINQAF